MTFPRQRTFVSQVLIYVLALSGLSCSHTSGRPACEGDLSRYENQARCHDEAFYGLSSQPAQSLNILLALCDRHNLARACSNAAHAHENPLSVDFSPDFVKAGIYYQKGCELGDGVACHNLANLHILGRGTPQDDVPGVHFLKKACDLNYAQACFRLAVITQRGKVVAPDPDAVAEYMSKGCDLGDMTSCHDLGYLYLEGTGVERSIHTALELFKRSCLRGLPRGCGSLGYLHMQEGSEYTDFTKAVELLQAACSGDDTPSCSNLGYLIETGKGSPPDPARAAQFYSKACRGGDMMGCGNLGVLLAEGKGVDPDDLAAFPLLERGCSDSGPEACRYLAIFHAEGRATLPRSESTAAYYRTKACENGDPPSCATLSKGFVSLCLPGESMAMACMTGQERMFSLCSQTTSDDEKSLVYRFGTRTDKGLEFGGDFQLTSDRWTGGENHRLEFTNGSARYSLVETTATSQDPPRKRMEIVVEQDGIMTHIACRYPIMGALNSDSIKAAVNLSPGGE